MSTNKSSEVCFVTGSNGDFGRSLTKAVLAQGDRVVATTRHPEQTEDLVKAFGLDIIKAEKINLGIDTALSTFRRMGRRNPEYLF